MGYSLAVKSRKRAAADATFVPSSGHAAATQCPSSSCRLQPPAKKQFRASEDKGQPFKYCHFCQVSFPGPLCPRARV